MNALLYGLVVVIWGTTWIAIFLQQGPVAAPVSIFWRFAVASAAMMLVLLALGRLRKLAVRDHLFCMVQGCCVFCFNFWCFYTAAKFINTGLESVIFSMAVLYNAINSFIFFGQRPPARFWAARHHHPFLGRFAGQRLEPRTAAGYRPVSAWDLRFLAGQYDQPSPSA